ncbi:cupin domain-containing protein [Saccharopolyspora rosea]|uniref:Cupin domain-containing protein n=1 Tax=Saccharopolyspora rosea TaxID=524884 RepID=A0ABW3FZ32_9PSEU|nr:cupin domain-containing protein [Saccharopolyspora rosea]
MTEDPAEVAARYGLRPLPVEGGLFRRTWTGPPDGSGRPAGTAILLLLAARDGLFSALHRLPIDEVWHFHRGDPVALLLLDPGGGARTAVLGHDPAAGHHVQFTVPAGTWMGGRVAPGGSWALCGTTMAPGFLPSDYEGAAADDLAAAYPSAAEDIRALCRPGTPLRMPPEDPPR